MNCSLSNGEQYITTAQLERRIREICNTTLRKDAEDSDEPDDDSPGMIVFYSSFPR